MNDRPLIDIDELLEEIDRYLGAVDLFRSVDCAPSWRPELVAATQLADEATEPADTPIAR